MNTTLSAFEDSLGDDGFISDGDWIETKDQDPAGGVRLIQLADIGDGSFLNKSQRFLNEKTARRLRCTYLKEGDLLIARLPDPIGRACVFPGFKFPCVAAVDICIVRPNPKALSATWLCGYINCPSTRQRLNQLAQGATRKRVPTGKIRELPVPVVEISEQRKIGDQLDEYRSLYANAKAGIAAQLADAKLLAESIIRSSIAGTPSPSINLGEVLEEIRHGIGVNWKDSRVLGATRQGLALAKEPPGKNPQRYKPVTPGTVFYNPMRIMIGSIAFVAEDDEPGITSPDYVVLKGKCGVVDSRWFYYWLRSPLGEACIQSLARGAVRERMLFNRLAEGEIELPDYETQLKASKALAEIKPMQTAIESQIEELELVPQKILAQTFES